LQEEIWKDYAGFEEIYQVSTCGNVRSLDRVIIQSNGRIKKIKGIEPMKTRINKFGYGYIALRLNGKYKMKTVHRMVAETFIHNVHNKPEVNHISGSKIDNRVQNLEWLTSSENQLHAYKNGLQKPRRGADSNLNKIPEYRVRVIKKLKGKIYQKIIANYYGIAQCTVSEIQTGFRWGHITV
jgi:hypothetical protein